MRARQRLRDRQVLAPADSVLRRALGSARQAARGAMVERMEATLSASQRERLDGLVDTGDDRFSALNRIEASPPSPSAVGMRRLLGRLELIEATGATMSRRTLSAAIRGELAAPSEEPPLRWLLRIMRGRSLRSRLLRSLVWLRP